MLLWTFNSWDLKINDQGQIYFPIHRHDGSVLQIPVAHNLLPVGTPDMQFKCLSGQYKDYCGYQTGWVPQDLPPVSLAEIAMGPQLLLKEISRGLWIVLDLSTLNQLGTFNVSYANQIPALTSSQLDPEDPALGAQVLAALVKYYGSMSTGGQP